MSIRSKFTPLNEASQGVGGACNMGIVIVRHNPSGITCVEKRVPPVAVACGTAETEAEAMKQCGSHPNIVRLRGYTLDYRSTG
jgi:hypothetical protein